MDLHPPPLSPSSLMTSMRAPFCHRVTTRSLSERARSQDGSQLQLGLMTPTPIQSGKGFFSDILYEKISYTCIQYSTGIQQSRFFVTKTMVTKQFYNYSQRGHVFSSILSGSLTFTSQLELVLKIMNRCKCVNPQKFNFSFMSIIHPFVSPLCQFNLSYHQD